MRFGLLFKPLFRLFIISERNITLVSREFPRIFPCQENDYEANIAQRIIIIIKVKFAMKCEVRHKVIYLQLNATRNTNNYYFINHERAESQVFPQSVCLLEPNAFYDICTQSKNIYIFNRNLLFKVHRLPQEKINSDESDVSE